MTTNKIKTPLEKKSFVRSKPLAGFTLMEIVVSLVILAAVFAGLTATFVGVKRYVSRASRRLTAVNLGRQALNSLYVHPRADTWNTGALAVGTYSFAAGAVTQVPNSITIDNFTYGDTIAGIDNFWPDPNSYRVRTVGAGANLREYREVTATVWYPVN